MELIATEVLPPGILAWFRIAGSDTYAEFYTDDDLQRVCYYPGWDELNSAEQTDIVVEMHLMLLLGTS